METPKEVLNKVFGYESFREGQEELINNILDGQDGLAVMPTGHGKSLIFQIPAILRHGMSVVVSPLISLMKDQVDSLRKLGVKASYLNSTQTIEEVQSTFQGIIEGDIKILYISPERIQNSRFQEVISKATISFVVVDEAHCLSQWGHDFRPDYKKMNDLLSLLNKPQCVGFTATATDFVRSDIQDTLVFRDGFDFTGGFARPNLSMNITKCVDADDKLDRVLEIVKQHKTGIVYCSTKKRLKEVEDFLKKKNIGCRQYHGTIPNDEKNEIQEGFINGKIDVLIATKAFGMGIDRGDVRFVIHYSISDSMESLTQEWGRAGRDGKEAHCELLHHEKDEDVQFYFIESGNPSHKEITSTYNYLQEHQVNGLVSSNSAYDIDKSLGIKSQAKVNSALDTLVRLKYIIREGYGRSGKITLIGNKSLSEGLLPKDVEDKLFRDTTRFQRILEYVEETKQCRQESIMHHFNQMESYSCGKCDNCNR